MHSGIRLHGGVPVLLVTVALVAVACGTSNPTSHPSLGVSAPSSVPNATPGLVAPTPEPAHTVRISEVECPTSFGLPGETMPPLPATMTATLTPDVAAIVSYYGNGTLTLLGPKGWHCEAAVGVNGSARMAITPPGKHVGSGSASSDIQAITASTGGACVACIASMACGLFPEAWNLFAQPDLSCPARLPSRELVNRPGPQAAAFEDPPGVAGTGDPSGGRYRAFGFVVFDPGTAAGGNGRSIPSVLKVTCTLPDAMAQICDELVEGAARS